MKATDEQDDDDDDDGNPERMSETRNGQVDRFYLERHEARNVGGYYLPSLTYLEEKGLFWRSKIDGISTQLTPEQRRNVTQFFNIRPPPPPIADGFGFLGFYDDDEDFLNLAEQRRIIGIGENVAIGPGDAEFGHIAEIAAMRETDANFSQFYRRQSRMEDIASVNSTQPMRNCKDPKIVLHCHRHLVDRHLQGKPAICDELGNMSTSPVSLSVDFFHPVLSRPPACSANQEPDALDASPAAAAAARSPASRHGMRTLSARPPSRRQAREPNDQRLRHAHAAAHAHAHAAAAQSTTLSHGHETSQPLVYKFVEHRIISELELYCYASESGEDYDIARRRSSYKNLKTTQVTPKISLDKVADMLHRYERKVTSLLKRGDYSEFDECMLDFWDAFFPLTATVHFYDQHTPVPRMSKMHRFLTRPCPKAFGTMQCEIERIRVRYRTKGMMPGRYYSTYEYRLFIRDRRKPNYDGTMVDEFYPRMDTVLMTGKYRGKHYSGPTGLAPVTSGNRGVNHYFLYMPQQSDIDEHFDLANEHVDLNGCHRYRQEVPAAGSILELCRLQTNYLGTEFQISSPCALDPSEDTAIRERGDNETTRSSLSAGPASKQSKAKRHPNFKKWGKKNKDNNASNRSLKSSTKSRIAARISPFSAMKKNGSNNELQSSTSGADNEIPQPIVKEREVGAITYTANVLGNRPRIMNVCVPKVSSETEMPIESDDVWIKTPGEDDTMLRRLKSLQLQQGANTTETNGVDALGNSAEDDYGLISLQNRPPWWNVEIGAFVLNFGGRVSVASVKNFQLCDRDDHDNIMLQFGRIEGRHSFTMDFSYPLSPIQAFAISISSLQSKISFA